MKDKIHRVHLAARDGNLRDLQSALDRRKFATARDDVSPHGATPLHVATIFGHAGNDIFIPYYLVSLVESFEFKCSVTNYH